jgi:hypothetical protein
LIELLDKYGLRKKIIAYVKDEGSNLNVMTNVLKFVLNCESFGIKESLHGPCFGHAFSKSCQYGTTKEKNCKNLKYVFIKFAQIDLQKCITWPKKSWKGKHEWNEACLEIGIQTKKLNTLIKTE